MRSLLLILCLSSTLFGISSVWTPGTGGNWNDGTNWNTDPIFPNGPTDSAIIVSINSPGEAILLGQNITIGSLELADCPALSIEDFQLTLDGGGIVDSSNGSYGITSDIRLNTTAQISVDIGSSLLIDGQITGSGGITFLGSAALSIVELGGIANTYSGPTKIIQGVFVGIVPAGNEVFLGNGIFAPGSTIFTVDAPVDFSRAFSATLDSDGKLIQASGTFVSLSKLQGVGEIALDDEGFAILDGGDSNYGGVISGGQASASFDPNTGARLIKSGNSRLTLSGVNTYMSRTFVNDGSQIRLQTDSALGDAPPSNSDAFASDGGAFEFDSSVNGDLTLNKRFRINGNGESNQGALHNVAGDNTIPSTGLIQVGWSGGSVIASDATIGVDSGTTLTIEAMIEGANNLTKVGEGELLYTGSTPNTLTGTTTISAGSLTLDKSAVESIAGPLIINGGIVQLSQSEQIEDTTEVTIESGIFDLNGNAESIGQLICNGGTFQQDGAVLTLTSSGIGLSMMGGTLIPQTVALSSGAGKSILFNGTNGTATIANLLMSDTSREITINNGASTPDMEIQASMGAGFSKLGSGELRLSGIHDHSGPVSVSTGTLFIAGDLTATSLTIDTQGTLTGGGNITAPISNSGTINPGAGIGTLHVTGDVGFNSGSTFDVDLNSSISDLLLVQGDVTIASGSTLSINPTFDQFATSYLFTIISTPGNMVTGEFSNIVSSLPFFVNAPTYLSDAVLLTLTRIPFSDVVTKGNAAKVAKCLDELASTATGDLAFVLNLLQTSLSVPILTDALTQLQPSMLKGLALSQESNAFFLRSLLEYRIYNTNRQICKCCEESRCIRSWASLGWDTYLQKREGKEVGFHADTGYGFIGLDYQPICDALIGISVGYTYSDLAWKESRGTGTIQSGYGALYGSWLCNGFFVDGVFLGAYNHYNEKRDLRFRGLYRRAHGDFDGSELLANLRLGSIFTNGCVELRPFISVDYLSLWQNSFQEKGAKSLNLVVSSSHYTMLYAEAGTFLSFCYNCEPNLLFFDLRLSYIHEQRFNGETYKARFNGTDCSFHVKGLNPNRNIFSPGLGIRLDNCCNYFQYSINYDGEFADHFRNHNLFLTVEYSF